MTEVQFKMSDKAFYRSRYSGLLPCEVLEIGSRRIRIRIEGYNSKLWVRAKKLLSTSQVAIANEEAGMSLKKINRRMLMALQHIIPALEHIKNE